MDAEKNAECYGEGTTAMHILEGDVKSLYDTDINALYSKLDFLAST